MATATKFGKYTLVERIAVGGMAEIYRAKTFGAAGFEKDLVIKRILPQFSADDDFVRMFIDEARLAAKLQHANVVQIFDFDNADMGDGTSYFIAMELVDGKDVRHLLKESVRQNKPLSVPMCLHVAIEALKGLHYAHTKAEDGKPLNIVHRDVSPHNLLVSYAGEVKISDFGIAKAAARASATSNGMVKGKLAYMSPEQVTGQALDRRTDVYSMGIVLYEMLTRTRLFAGQTDAEVISKVRDAVVPPLRQRNPQVPPDVEQVVMKMLAHSVNNRFQSAADAARALSQTSAYSANEAAPLGEYVAQLFPPAQRRSVPAPAPAPVQAAPKPAAASMKAAEGASTMMADAPAEAMIAAAKAQAAAKPAPAEAPKPIAEQATAILDGGSPEMAKVQAQIQAAMAQKGAAGAGAAPPAAAAAPKPISEQATAILDGQSPEMAKVQAQIQAAMAQKGAGGGSNNTAQVTPMIVPPSKPAPNIMEQSTAILDASSPQHAKVQAQIAAAVASRGAPPPMAAGGPPPMAPPSAGPPPSNATVMLDSASMPMPPPRAQAPKQQLAPIQTKAAPKQSTWGRWVLGPSIMSVTALATWLLAGFLFPAKTIDDIRKPPPVVKVKARIQLRTDPPGATVTLDDVEQKHLTPTQLDGFLNETKHLTIALAGYKKHEEEVIFSAEDRPLTVTLDKLDEAPRESKHHSSSHHDTPTPKGGPGIISVFCTPYADVFVDGKRIRQTPIANLELPAGKHEFKLVCGDKTERLVSRTLKSGSNEEIREKCTK